MRVDLVLALSLAIALGGCKREPTFEERYDTANRTIVERAKGIDAQIAGTPTAPPPKEQDDLDGL